MTARRMVLLAGALIWAVLVVAWFTNAPFLTAYPALGWLAFVLAILPVILIFDIILALARARARMRDRKDK